MAQRFLLLAVIVAVLFGAAVSLAGATGPASVDGGSGVDEISGAAGDDRLKGVAARGRTTSMVSVAEARPAARLAWSRLAWSLWGMCAGMILS